MSRQVFKLKFNINNALSSCFPSFNVFHVPSWIFITSARCFELVPRGWWSQIGAVADALNADCVSPVVILFKCEPCCVTPDICLVNLNSSSSLWDIHKCVMNCQDWIGVSSVVDNLEVLPVLFLSLREYEHSVIIPCRHVVVVFGSECHQHSWVGWSCWFSLNFCA